MPDIDLNAMSLPDLKQLKREVDKTISGFGAQKKAEARAVVEAKARELGFSLSELADGSDARRRGAGTPKYRHPENPDVTWTGRGRKPRWVAEHLAAGKDIADLEI